MADLQKQVGNLTRELKEANERQNATAEILQVINSSPGDLAPVFETILEKAHSLCAVAHGSLMLCHDEKVHAVAVRGLPEAFAAYLRQGFVPSPNLPHGRLLEGARFAQVQDWAEIDHPIARAALSAGIRTMLSVPLRREGKLLGWINAGRQEVRPFTEKEIALLESFAAQAVIAIENARLFSEVQAKTHDLEEALRYQTGSANILNVIASSPTDVQPVLKAIVESACNLCEAYDAVVMLKEGGELRLGTHHGPIPMSQLRWANDRGSISGRAIADRQPVHVRDVLSDEGVEFGVARDMSARDGCHTLLGAPLLREGEAIGAIVLRRAEIHPFSEKQIALLQTFADHAVIALGNVRLFEEVQAKTRDLEESLQQQTATADVLKVISRSTFDLQTVLNTLVSSAARLCDADMALIMRREGDVYRAGAAVGFSEEFFRFLETLSIPPDRGTIAGRAAVERRTVQIPDVAADPEYTLRESTKMAGQRTALGVPLLRENDPIGVIVIARKRVEEFSEKQIELVSTFADQAVIAIENVRLFDELRQRTNDLAQSLENLRTAQDRLIQTEKLASLGQLTAGIAHEIKNPLNFVNNFSALSVELTDELNDVLKQATLADKIRAEIDELTGLLKDNLGKVVQHGKRADSIVKNMLLHSREGSGERRFADINALVRESLNLAYHGARAEKAGFSITLKHDLDPEAGEVDLYPQEITRALLNLISNGFYAAARRKVEASGEAFEPALVATTKNLGKVVEIRIRDNGTGIPAEVREKMFNPFFTTKPTGEGTGLGLSITHDIIVKQHGGRIDLQTEPGLFTEFIITLPRENGTAAGQNME